MGFYSWNCKGCGESIKAPYSLPAEIAWQNTAVALTEDGSVLIGEYDGYGRINGMEPYTYISEWWHHRCYLEKGKPEYSGPSEHAEDQGFFYD